MLKTLTIALRRLRGRIGGRKRRDAPQGELPPKRRRRKKRRR